MNSVKIDCSRIKNWSDFHDIFKKTIGFPEFYGRNMDAWIDCMTNLDDEFSTISIKEGDVFTLELENVRIFKKDYPDITIH